MLIRFIQFLKAERPILLTLSGSSTFLKLLHSKKALSPISETPSLTTTAVISLRYSHQGASVFSLSLSQAKSLIAPLPEMISVPFPSICQTNFLVEREFISMMSMKIAPAIATKLQNLDDCFLVYAFCTHFPRIETFSGKASPSIVVPNGTTIFFRLSQP